MIKNEIKKIYLNAGRHEGIACTLPCTLYSVLLSNGIIDDPLYGTNIEKVTEGIPELCTYYTDVDLSVSEATAKHVYLRLRGVLAKAEVFFNGRSYGTVAAHDRVSVFDVTDLVKVGINKLEVRCLSPLQNRRIIRGDGSISTEFEMAPYLPDMGITGGIEFLSTNDALIKEIGISQLHDNGKVTLNIGVETLGTDEDVRAMATLVSPTGKIYFGGISNGVGTISIPDPELWWPNGLGNHLLYKLTVTLYHGELAADSYQCQIGLRSVSLERNANGVPYIKINGTALFAMGATYIPENPIRSNINPKNTERLIKQAAEANMNTLRVISEGICPDDSFYSLCDKYGILVWQDLSVPYIASSVTGAFAAGITDTVRDVIRRTTRHSSVVLTYLSVTEVRDTEKTVTEEQVREFRELASRIITPVVEKCGNGVLFIYDSDELFSHDEKYLHVKKGSFRKLALPSVPDVSTLSRFTPPEEMNICSPTLEAHCNCGHALGNMLSAICHRFRFPSGIEELSYVSALSEGYATRDSVLLARAERDNCMSAVCRQLNDGWPAISPAAVDFYGRAKAVMHLAKKFFSPFAVCAVANGKNMKLYVSNDTKKAYTGRLVYSLYSKNGACLRETRADVSLEPMSAALIVDEDFSKYIDDASECYLLYELGDNSGVQSAGISIFVPSKRFKYENPEIKTEISGSGKKFVLKLYASTLAMGVEISFVGINAKLSSNYIDLSNVSAVMINVETEDVVTSGELESRLSLRCEWGIGR